MRILVVEDNPCTQLLLNDSLELLGHESHVVNNGAEALAILGQTVPFDLVLLDMEMPLMSGQATAKAIRSGIPSARQPRILLSSARTEGELRRICQDGDIDGYLCKPVTIPDLQNALGDFLEKRDSSAIRGGDIPSCLDAEQIEEILSLHEPGENVLEDLLEVFAERSQALLQELTTEALHELRGCALSLGAQRVVESCQRIEAAGHANPKDVEELGVRVKEALLALQELAGRLTLAPR